MIFTLVVATLGRDKELHDMLVSVQKSSYPLDKIEVIIVDQNEIGFLSNSTLNIDGLNIKHIHSDKKGLSYNRNLGIKEAKGDIICFPDDDCQFYIDTLSNVKNILSDDATFFCLGKIFDREKNIDVFKKWPKHKKQVTRFNSYFLNSSITLFLKNKGELFDEKLGVGGLYGSCEDADFLYRILKDKKKGVYNPDIQMWHPAPDFSIISLEKVENYASGFAYFYRKDTDIIKQLLMTMLVVKKVIQYCFSRNKFTKGYFKVFFRGLFQRKC